MYIYIYIYLTHAAISFSFFFCYFSFFLSFFLSFSLSLSLSLSPTHPLDPSTSTAAAPPRSVIHRYSSGLRGRARGSSSLGSRFSKIRISRNLSSKVLPSSWGSLFFVEVRSYLVMHWGRIPNDTLRALWFCRPSAARLEHLFIARAPPPPHRCSWVWR